MKIAHIDNRQTADERGASEPKSHKVDRQAIIDTLRTVAHEMRSLQSFADQAAWDQVIFRAELAAKQLAA